MLHDPLALLALTVSAVAVVMLGWFLVRRPPLTRAIKIVLLFALGVFPLTAAMTGNVSTFEATKRVTFCGGCHVMEPYASDAKHPTSDSLAARHSRNAAFGDESCYQCHADYGMFGTVTTKLGGLRHVYYQLTSYRSMTVEEALPTIHLVGEFRNATCMRCHSATGPAWNQVVDHFGLADELRRDSVGCIDAGCHGPAHPFSKVGR